MTEHRVLVVDAFTKRAYGGNPCAVVFDADDLSSGQMQMVAQEMNLSETAFILASNRAKFRVRYFTPRTEIPFAGHPTIAVTYAMAMQGNIRVPQSRSTIEIEFEIGVLPVTIEAGEAGVERIIMTQPAPEYADTAAPRIVAEALQLTEEDLLSASPPQVASVGVPFLMIGVKDRETLLGIQPNWDELQSVCNVVDVSAAYLYALGGHDSDVDLCARFLDPFAMYEDPFTGSACGAMAALAARNGLIHKGHVVVEQGEGVGRIGYADVHLQDVDSKILVGGAAALVLSGSITAPLVIDGGNQDNGG
ncbi:PhzF family phenazine biosynthesis protein [Candidatus Acetothermia bacterium]|nr:MAG: PhzF family phenazine biosynthesis protein [Candidatus Acetothermia bacterium]